TSLLRLTYCVHRTEPTKYIGKNKTSIKKKNASIKERRQQYDIQNQMQRKLHKTHRCTSRNDPQVERRKPEEDRSTHQGIEADCTAARRETGADSSAE